MNNIPISIFWFRRDLRTHDNHGLLMALKSGYPVLPIFIFDEDELSKLNNADARIEFVLNNLSKIKNHFETLGSSLEILIDNPLDAWSELIKKHNVKKVFINTDYEPSAIQRDENIKNLLIQNGIILNSYKDHVIFEKNELLTVQDNPFTSFTDYQQKWKRKYDKTYYSSEKYLSKLFKTNKFQDVELQTLGFTPSNVALPEINLSSQMISKYDRNKDFPYLNATSHIGIHLRFGTVSIRQCVEEAVKVIDNSWLEGLIWRDFFTQILYHFPQVENHSFKSIYDNIEWKNNIEFYKKWIDGQTGVALVDAGMRELNATGFMNNQVRMITASFLCKNLHISWKWGERYFSKKLLDYDLALNVGNWQWIAGNGADASPYFKVFNPKVQMETYDSLNNYVKKWVPEYKSENYKPIINFEQSRNECFDLYKKALINKQ